MPIVHFLGKIVPSNHYSATMWGLPEIQYRSPDIDFQCAATISIEGSNIDVKCVVNRYELDLRIQMHKLAYDLARAAVNLLCFSTGLYLSIFSMVSSDQTAYGQPL
jgi:hypothetical protein